MISDTELILQHPRGSLSLRDHKVDRQPEKEVGIERWLGKFGQTDKWKICLRAARVPRIRSDNGKTGPPDA
jgi:hypothetical protein